MKIKLCFDFFKNIIINSKYYLEKLNKIPINNVTTLYSPLEFYDNLIKLIHNAKKRIYLIALYLERDQGGKNILHAIYNAKAKNPNLEIAILVDLNRARRSFIKIGTDIDNSITNADWYFYMSKINPDINVPIYGISINKREILGVFHIKGFIIDSEVLYSGASLNNVYLQQFNKYRIDRYKVISNIHLANSLLNYVKENLINNLAVVRLDKKYKTASISKYHTKTLRKNLKKEKYKYKGYCTNNVLSITPLIGIGVNNQLNKTIINLLLSTNKYAIICTPYFNLPSILEKIIIKLLSMNKIIKIIVCDKQANEFYSKEYFNIVNLIPYVYEINLRKFMKKLQKYIDNKNLVIYLWKHKSNTFHVKGIWVDNNWQLITGNNLNFRSWRFDLENALLIHDPNNSLEIQKKNELKTIFKHTNIIKHFSELEDLEEYPIKIRQLIYKIKKIKFDKIIKYIL